MVAYEKQDSLMTVLHAKLLSQIHKLILCLKNTASVTHGKGYNTSCTTSTENGKRSFFLCFFSFLQWYCDTHKRTKTFNQSSISDRQANKQKQNLASGLLQYQLMHVPLGFCAWARCTGFHFLVHSSSSTNGFLHHGLNNRNRAYACKIWFSVSVSKLDFLVFFTW